MTNDVNHTACFKNTLPSIERAPLRHASTKAKLRQSLHCLTRQSNSGYTLCVRLKIGHFWKFCIFFRLRSTLGYFRSTRSRPPVSQHATKIRSRLAALYPCLFQQYIKPAKILTAKIMKKKKDILYPTFFGSYNWVLQQQCQHKWSWQQRSHHPGTMLKHKSSTRGSIQVTNRSNNNTKHFNSTIKKKKHPIIQHT